MRGLLHSIRVRLHTLQAQKQTLLQQMEDVPADAPLSAAASNAKLANLIEQNMSLKEESAAMVQEKVTLQELLKQHRDTGKLTAAFGRDTMQTCSAAACCHMHAAYQTLSSLQLVV